MAAPNGDEYVCTTPEEIAEAVAEILCTPQPKVSALRDDGGVGPRIRKKSVKQEAETVEPDVVILNNGSQSARQAQAAPAAEPQPQTPPNISAFDSLLIDAGMSIFQGLQRASSIATPNPKRK